MEIKINIDNRQITSSRDQIMLEIIYVKFIEDDAYIYANSSWVRIKFR